MFYSVEFVGMVISSLIAIIALFLTIYANSIAKKANELTKCAVEESEKENFPLVKFVDNIEVANKDYDTLGNEIIFDLNSMIFDGNTMERDEIPCIIATLENIGNGILTGIEIEKILICNRNKLTIDYRYEDFEENIDILFYEEYEEKNKIFQDMVLCKGEKVEINFFIDRPVKMKEIDELDYDLVKEQIEEFFERNRYITIVMSINLLSINGSQYKQKSIIGSFRDRKCTFNSFSCTEKDKIFKDKYREKQ